MELNLKPLNYWMITALILFIATSLVTLRSCTTSQPVPSATSVPTVATVSKPLVNVTKVEVSLETPKAVLKVYPKSAKGKLSLPKAVSDSQSTYVTDSSVIKRSEQNTEVSQVVDTTTGETTTYVTQLPSPWFALEHRGVASIDYGFKRNASNPVARLNVREDFLQIKGIHLGITGSIHTDGDYFVGLGGAYKW